MHTTCVYGLALWFRLSWTMYDQATAAATSKFHPLMLPERTTQVYKGKNVHQLFLLIFCLQMILLIQDHVAFVYVVNSGLDVITRDTPIDLLN